MLKEVEEGGLVAWNYQKEHQHLFATASVNLNQESQGLLQIFKFDILDTQKRPQEIGSFNLPCLCKSVAWSTFGEEYGYDLGLILLGFEDGSISIVNAKALLYEYAETEQAPQIIHEERDIFENSGPIESLQYNNLKPNLIAIGGEEVLIMDIQIQDGQVDPILFSPDADNNPHQNSTVTAVSWNKKLSHILASASQNGITVIWDLKSNKPIKSFGGDSFGTLKDVCLAWSPEYPTCVAKSEEESKQQEVQIWDLRNPKGPVMILEKVQAGGHTGHISCISWCEIDTSLILTGGHDQKVICWSIKDQQPICIEEFEEPIKQVSWSQINNLYSVTLESGKVILKSLNNDDSAIAPPRWYMPPVGARFSPNGDLVAHHESCQNLKIQHRGVEPTNEQFLILDEFFEIYSNAENLVEICDWVLKNKKSNVTDTLIWKILKGQAANNNDFILECLGFNKQEIQKKAETYTGKTHKKAEVQEQNLSNQNNNQKRKQVETTDIARLDEKDALDFFNDMAQESQKPKEVPQDRSTNFKRLASSNNGQDNEEIYQHETISRNVNWDTGVERVIKENLIISNFEGAIDSAMKCGRQAEALLLAYSQGQDVFESVLKDYFVSNTDPFIKNIIKNIVKKNNEEMIQSQCLDHWKECVGMLLTSVQNKVEFQNLMNTLGDRFINELKDENNAIHCYLLAHNFEKLAKIYYDRVSVLRYNSLQRKMEQARYLQILVSFNHLLKNANDSNVHYNYMIYETSRYLYEDNMILAAYSSLVEGDQNYAKIANFLDLLYTSHQEKISQFYDKPQVPYKPKDIKVVQQPGNKNAMGRGPVATGGNVKPQFGQKTPVTNNLASSFGQPGGFGQTGGFMPPPPIGGASNKADFGTNPFGNRPPPVNNTNMNTGAFNEPPKPVSNQTVNPPPVNRVAPPPIAKKEHKPFNQPKNTPPPPIINKNQQQQQLMQQSGGLSPPIPNANQGFNRPPSQNNPPFNPGQTPQSSQQNLPPPPSQGQKLNKAPHQNPPQPPKSFAPPPINRPSGPVGNQPPRGNIPPPPIKK